MRAVWVMSHYFWCWNVEIRKNGWTSVLWQFHPLPWRYQIYLMDWMGHVWTLWSQNMHFWILRNLYLHTIVGTQFSDFYVSLLKMSLKRIKRTWMKKLTQYIFHIHCAIICKKLVTYVVWYPATWKSLSNQIIKTKQRRQYDFWKRLF